VLHVLKAFDLVLYDRLTMRHLVPALVMAKGEQKKLMADFLHPKKGESKIAR
jgi:hypothetical protein